MSTKLILSRIAGLRWLAMSTLGNATEMNPLSPSYQKFSVVIAVVAVTCGIAGYGRRDRHAEFLVGRRQRIRLGGVAESAHRDQAQTGDTGKNQFGAHGQSPKTAFR